MVRPLRGGLLVADLLRWRDVLAMTFIEDGMRHSSGSQHTVQCLAASSPQASPERRYTIRPRQRLHAATIVRASKLVVAITHR